MGVKKRRRGLGLSEAGENGSLTRFAIYEKQMMSMTTIRKIPLDFVFSRM